jgi:hypothetical protein
MQAISSTRPGGHVGYVGVAHEVELPGEEIRVGRADQLDGPLIHLICRLFLLTTTCCCWRRSRGADSD